MMGMLSLLAPAQGTSGTLGAASRGNATAPVTRPAIEVVGAQWTVIRFQPQYPHDRHTQNQLPGNGVSIDAASPVSYRIPLPDFVADKQPDQVFLLADIDGDINLKVEDTLASASTCPAEPCNKLRLSPAARKELRVLKAEFKPAQSQAPGFPI